MARIPDEMITCRAAPSTRGLVLIYLIPQLDPL